MEKYHKINSVYKRDMNKNGDFILGKWSNPEFEYLQNLQWEFTEKVDGTNIRIHKTKDSVGFMGRNDNSQIPKHLLQYLKETFTMERLSVIGCEEFTLYGEGYGHKIQNGGDFFPNENKVSFILFDVKIIGNWQPRANVVHFANALKINFVPIVFHGTLSEGIELCNVGFSSVLKKNGAKPEGLIAKPMVELLDRSGNRIITKIKLCDFNKND